MCRENFKAVASFQLTLALPEDYVIEHMKEADEGDDGYTATLRMPFSTESQVLEWKRSFEQTTKSVFRCEHTRKAKGIRSIFNVSCDS